MLFQKQYFSYSAWEIKTEIISDVFQLFCGRISLIRKLLLVSATVFFKFIAKYEPELNGNQSVQHLGCSKCQRWFHSNMNNFGLWLGMENA